MPSIYHPDQKLITTKNAAFCFYDIESTKNLFTIATYRPKINQLYLFYLWDVVGTTSLTTLESEIVRAKIISTNETIGSDIASGKIELHMINILTDAGLQLFKATFGFSTAGKNIANPKAKTPNLEPEDVYPIICDISDEFDPYDTHPYLIGYNSTNYDTTMLALLMMCIAESTIENRALMTNLANDVENYREAPTGTQQWNVAHRNLTKSRSFTLPTAAKMREHNDQLFSADYKSFMPSYLWKNRDLQMANNFRTSMTRSGRYLDASLYNEKQSKQALKRLSGAQGYPIVESKRLTFDSLIYTIEDFAELAAYNVSDVVVLHMLFEEKTYSSGFDQKMALLMKYPEMVFGQKINTFTGEKMYAPDTGNLANVRANRLNPDSTSAKFVTYTLCPYGALEDIPVVDFSYPETSVAKEQGITPFNVLEMLNDFFAENFKDLPHAAATFKDTYTLYSYIQGRNFNGSTSPERQEIMRNYRSKVGPELEAQAVAANPEANLETLRSQVRDQIMERGLFEDYAKSLAVGIPDDLNTNVIYYDKFGESTGCFATFSTGGIHGAEYAKDLHTYHLKQVQKFNENLKLAIEHFGTPTAAFGPLAKTPVNPDDPRTREPHFITEDGYTIYGRDFLTKSGSISAGTKTFVEPKAKPELFKREIEKGKVTYRLNKKYVYTSLGLVNHEDFKSYYPLLLINLAAFVNPNFSGDDAERYLSFFNGKEEYGAMLKDVSLDDITREIYSLTRAGFKLLLNAATGAADMTYDIAIRMNNRIITMRIIGQLFTYMVAATQALEGARPVSTNTDGVYTKMDATINNQLLEKAAEKIHVEIEPEEMLLVSKDTNNRAEFSLPTTEFTDRESAAESLRIINAGGGQLACHNGPNPGSALSHAAVIDHLLINYFRYLLVDYYYELPNPLTIEQEADTELITHLMNKMRSSMDPRRQLLFFSHVIASSPSSITYPFAVPLDKVRYDGDLLAINPNDTQHLQHINRVFYVKADTPQALTLHSAGAWKPTPAMLNKRSKNGQSPIFTDAIGAHILSKENVYRYSPSNPAGAYLVPKEQDVSVRAVTGIPRTQPVIIQNRAISALSDQEVNDLLESLDLQVYIQAAADTFNDSWRNIPVPADA